jgi:hypothetical protein
VGRTGAGAQAIVRPGWFTVGIALLLFAAGLYIVGREVDDRA